MVFLNELHSNASKALAQGGIRQILGLSKGHIKGTSVEGYRMRLLLQLHLQFPAEWRQHA
jgi:hypothetical protein